MIRIVTVTVCFLALALLLAGCSTGEGAPTHALPSSFPIPANSEIIKSEATQKDDSVIYRAEMEVELNTRALLRFFETALPEHGWRVCGALESNGNVLMLFSESECTEHSNSVSIRSAQDGMSQISIDVSVTRR